MFHGDANLCELPIKLTFCLGDWTLARLLVGRTTVSMKFGNTLIASVCDPQLFKLSRQLSFLEETEIMLSPFAKRSTNNQPTEIVYDDLSFECVPFLLAAVVGSLVFLGRSIGLSLTSTTRMFHSVSVECKAFLPGKRNSPD